MQVVEGESNSIRSGAEWLVLLIARVPRELNVRDLFTISVVGGGSWNLVSVSVYSLPSWRLPL